MKEVYVGLNWSNVGSERAGEHTRLSDGDAADAPEPEPARCRLCSQHTLVTVALLLAQYALALLVPSVKAVFALTGGTAVVGFCFIFPALFALNLLPRRGSGEDDIGMSGAEVGLAWAVVLLPAVLGAWSVAVAARSLGGCGGGGQQGHSGGLCAE